VCLNIRTSNRFERFDEPVWPQIRFMAERSLCDTHT
jgi:hypothetical protein